MLQNQPQPFHLPFMLGAALHNIDARGLYAGVAQQVGQLRQVLVQGVKGPGKQVTKVVGEDLPGLHPGPGAEGLHLSPQVGAVHYIRC